MSVALMGTNAAVIAAVRIQRLDESAEKIVVFESPLLLTYEVKVCYNEYNRIED